MFSLRDTPIKRKLMVVILATTAFGLLLMAGAVVTYEVVMFRASMLTSTSVLAEVVASLSTSSLGFDQKEDGAELLGALAAEHQITAAALYDPKGLLFASFTPGTTPEVLPAAPGPDGVTFDNTSLKIFMPAIEDGKRKGTLYVHADLSEMSRRLVFYGLLVLVAAVGATAMSAVVSTFLQRRISGPILELAATARGVSDRQDYSVRPVPRGRDEIGDLTEAFNQMLIRVAENEAALQMSKEIAESANRAKDEFLAILSHELRTPLTPVLATVSMLREEPGVPAALRPELEMIQRNVELEARLIDDLLDLTRISRGKLELHVAPLNLRPLLEQAVQSYLADQAAAKQQTVSVTFPENVAAHVLGDAPRLTQVLWNLMQNAVKFTPQGGSIRIKVFNAAAPQDAPPEVLVEITDSGIGIEPENLGRIFTAFEQGERSRTRIFGGLGLGLAISLAIAERHGGGLAAHSAGRDQGATFTLRLPTVAPPAPATAPLVAAPPASSLSSSSPKAAAVAPSQDPATPRAPARILLVEDHADTARQIARLLTREGHAVTTASTVAEAIRIGTEQAFDLLVSDLGLPDGSGHDVMRHLATTRHLAGIALSGYGMEEDVRASLAAGFRLHFTKPIHWPELKEAVGKLVRERGEA